MTKSKMMLLVLLLETIKKEMKEVLFNYDIFEEYEEKYEKNTLELISTCIFSLNHIRHTIIAGNSGIG